MPWQCVTRKTDMAPKNKKAKHHIGNWGGRRAAHVKLTKRASFAVRRAPQLKGPEGAREVAVAPTCWLICVMLWSTTFLGNILHPGV